jgi:membrane-associated PAP2 superfamily phosphatase
MNRTGLVIALVIGAGVGLAFGIYPQLDLAVSALFFDEPRKAFTAANNLTALQLRHAFTYVIWLVAAPAFIAVVVKLILPRRRMIIPGRAVLLLIVTLALAPGLVANVILKDYWGRPRPFEVARFNGPETFVPWWDPRGSCDKNCSFVAGEGAGAFWTLAPAVLAPPAWRPLAYGAALTFGILVSGLRIAFGAHFFSDAFFSGLFTFLIIWTMHGAIYRWRATRTTDEAVEHAIERVALPGYEAIERGIAHIRGRASERP